MRKAISIFAGLLVLGGTGCEIRQAMYDQPKYRPLQYSEFFGDDRSSRPTIPGTVAQGLLNADAHLMLGEVDGKPAELFPEPVTMDMLQRGRERFNIFCSPCHDRAGTGNGMVVQRGFKKPVSFHDPRLRASPVGYFYGNITKGFGQMPSYAAQIPVRDRWAIVAYIRALQLSQQATLDDVPGVERTRLMADGSAAPVAAH
jgi:mono/diheme cytochrome c family protein